MPQAAERELDGSVTEYDEVDVAGDRVQRLLTELLTGHWRQLTVGPLIQGAVFEIRFAEPPKVSMLDGYMTVHVGPWHFHLCVNDHRDTTPELAAIRRVGRAAFFRTRGGGHVPMTWGLRLWNGRGEQMVTVLFPSAYYGDAMEPLREPDWSRTELWERFRARYASDPAPSRSARKRIDKVTTGGYFEGHESGGDQAAQGATVRVRAPRQAGRDDPRDRP